MSDLTLSQGGNRWLLALGNARNKDHVAVSQSEDASLGVVCAKATEVLTQASCDGRLARALEDVQKSHIETARSKLAKLLSETSVNGRLSAAIHEVQASQHGTVDSVESPVGVTDLDKSRSNLARLLADASADGRLYAALTEVQTGMPEAPETYCEEEEEESKGEKTEDIEALRLHALGMLTRAADDGSLFDALTEVHAQQPRLNLAGGLDDKRLQVTKMFGDAAASGTPCNAFREVREPERTWPLEDLRLKARHLLSTAADDGKLKNALAEVITPKVEDIETIRERTRKLLTRATDDGSLFKALHEVKTSAPQVAAAEHVEQARTSLAQLLAASSADGRLMAALREVQAPAQYVFQEVDEDADDFRIAPAKTQHANDAALTDDMTKRLDKRTPSKSADDCNVGAAIVDELRVTLSHALSQAADDGRLFAALSEVQTEEIRMEDKFFEDEVHVGSSSGVLEPEPVHSQDDIENIRLHTLAIFTKATEDGSLANILDDVKAQTKRSPEKIEASQSWRGACVLQCEDCAPQIRDALRQGNSSPNELEAAKLKLRNALAEAMSDGIFHNALLEAKNGREVPTLIAEPSPETSREISHVAPRPPVAKRETVSSRPRSLATILRKAPQVEENGATPSSNVGVPENVGPSLPVGPPGRAFRRRPRTSNACATPAVCIDIGEVSENTDGRDSSLARGYDALGAQLFSIGDRPESATRPPPSPVGNFNCFGRPVRSKSGASTSAMVATTSNVLDHFAVSAMELDTGNSMKARVEFGFCQAKEPQITAKLRSVSVGVASVGQKKTFGSLPAIKAKSSGRRLSHSVTNGRSKDPLAWTLGVSRRNLDSAGAVF